MDRESLIRTLIAGAIIIAIMWAWPYVAPYIPGLSKPAPTAPAEKSPAEKAPAEKAPAEKPGGEKPAGQTPPEKPAPEKPAPAEAVAVKAPALEAVGAAEGKPVVLGSAAANSPYDLEVEIDPRGAAVRRLTLSRRGFFKTVADRGLPADARQAMDLVEPGAPQAPLAIPELRVKLAGVDGWSKVDLSDVVWKADPPKSDAGPAALSVDVKDAAGAALLVVRKTFTLDPRKAEIPAVPQYELRMALEFAASDPRVEKVAYVLQGPPSLPKEAARGDFRNAAFGTWTGGRVQAEILPGSKIAKAEGTPPDEPARRTLGGAEARLAWVGQIDKYFAIVLIPQKPSAEGTFADAAEAIQYKVTEYRKDVPLASVRLLSNELALGPDKPVTHEVVVFAGPKDAKYLETYYAALGLDGLIQWAMCCVPIPGLDHLSRLLLKVIDVFHAAVANYGVAIILLVVVLRVVLLPVSRWSTKSMAEMQKMAPKMQEIREKHKDDQKKMQEEMAKIGGLKAFGGCLPMLLQTPIWISLYGALGAAVQLRHANFLPASWVPHWSTFLQDLSAPDALVTWQGEFYLPGHDVPILGWIVGGIQGMLGGPLTSFNVLPILVGAAMYIQQKLMPQTVASTDQARQQQKMMAFMPIFLGVVLYSVPSGLCLYIFTSTCLGFLEYKFFRSKWLEAGKPAPDSGPKPPLPDAQRKSLVSGRETSIAARARAWLMQRLEQPKDRDDGRKGKRG